jgi:catechol 2,3-dioxygenase-like lactoylglutathione lyase family enzyme
MSGQLPRVTPLKRTAIIVRDMERSLQFYRRVLGMKIWVRGEAGAELPELYRLLGAPPCRTRWIILQSADVDWGMVGLFELTDPEPPAKTHADPARANRGEACLVFHTPDVEAIYAGAKAMGLPVLCPPTVLEIKSHGIESLEMTIRDPNGVLVNFIENRRGGRLGLANRFPGLARQTRSPARPASRTGRKTGKAPRARRKTERVARRPRRK